MTGFVWTQTPNINSSTWILSFMVA